MKHKQFSLVLWLLIGVAVLLSVGAGVIGVGLWAYRRNVQSMESAMEELDSESPVNDNGPTVVANRIDKSALIECISAKDTSTRMPPEGKPLTSEQISLIKGWVKQGARSPADEKPEEDPRKHWAFVKPVRPAVPIIRNRNWVRNPIDAFIAEAHEQRGLKPLPAAKEPHSAASGLSRSDRFAAHAQRAPLISS